MSCVFHQMPHPPFTGQDKNNTRDDPNSTAVRFYVTTTVSTRFKNMHHISELNGFVNNLRVRNITSRQQKFVQHFSVFQLQINYVQTTPVKKSPDGPGHFCKLVLISNWV